MFHFENQYVITLDEYPDYDIYSDGVVYNHRLGRWLYGGITGSGYLTFRLKNVLGGTDTVGFHRLIAMAMCPYKGNYRDLCVNHIDGDKTNNHYTNLEWCSLTENNHHAGRLGMTSKCRPIALIDTRNNNRIIEFNSGNECARFLDETKDTIQYRVGFGIDRIFPDGYIYVYLEDLDKGLERLRRNYKPKKKFGRKVRVCILDTYNGEEIFYDSLGDVVKDFKMSLSGLYKWLSEDKQEVRYERYRFKFDDGRPWK